MKRFLSIFITIIFLWKVPSVYSLDSRQELFEEALLLSSGGDFVLALDKWNKYLELFPNDAAALSNRGNIKLVNGDPKGAIEDQDNSIDLDPNEIDPFINRGIAKEALQLWEEASEDYYYVLKKNPKDISALYNLGNVMGSMDNWLEAKKLFSQAASSNNAIAMARSSEALAIYQLGDLDLAEEKIRVLIRKYPLFADARAALSALLWNKGFIGEAESNWAAAAGLDIRYREKDWLLNIRRWPPKPTNDLISFLSLEDR